MRCQRCHARTSRSWYRIGGKDLCSLCFHYLTNGKKIAWNELTEKWYTLEDAVEVSFDNQKTWHKLPR